MNRPSNLGAFPWHAWERSDIKKKSGNLKGREKLRELEIKGIKLTDCNILWDNDPWNSISLFFFIMCLMSKTGRSLHNRVSCFHSLNIRFPAKA